MRQEMSGVEVVALTGTNNQSMARKSKTETTQEFMQNIKSPTEQPVIPENQNESQSGVSSKPSSRSDSSSQNAARTKPENTEKMKV